MNSRFQVNICRVAFTFVLLFLVWCRHASAQISEVVQTPQTPPTDQRDAEIAELKERVLALEKRTTTEVSGLKPGENKDPLKMEPRWKNALQYESADKAFRWSVGGVIQFDTTFYGAERDLVRSVGAFNNLVDPGLSLQDGMSFRRARLRFNGLMNEQIEFNAQYEFAQSLDLRRRTLGISPNAITANDFDPGDDTGFNEVYLGLTKLPVIGTIRVGRHRESLNFITATSDTNQVWLERGLMFDAFNGDFNFSNGVTISRTILDDRAYFLLGFFHSNNNSTRGFYAVGDGEYAYDIRLTALPVYDEARLSWVHVGVDYSYRNPHQYQVRYRARPDVRSGPNFLAPNIVNTGTIFTPDAQQIANLEFAMGHGRLTLAGEFTTSWVTNAYTGGLPLPNGSLPSGAVSRGTYVAQGGYVEAFCFLTPDHRPYQKDRPGYARVVPTSVFQFMDGKNGRILSLGAWEIGTRYEYLDLNSVGINGGMSNAVSACVNWYFNANARIQANYTWMDRIFSPSNSAALQNGVIHGFGMRFNVDF